MSIIEKKDCKRRKLHNTKVFTSCFPAKTFCYFCMEEIKTEENIKMEFIKEFEFIRNTAELKTLSNFSLENPLSDLEFQKMIKLKEELLNEK